MNNTIRTRIAPSPTGSPHVGTIYLSLFNYVFAKTQQGKFILRIEDTDRERSTKKSEDEIVSSLKWSGISWDEGPDIGGPYGPYRQSERTEIYKKYCNILLEKKAAYYCFCTPERIDSIRKEQMKNKAPVVKYDGHCQHLSEEEIQEKLSNNTPYVVRMTVPKTGTCCIRDLLRGNIEINYDQVDEQILMKSDGFPTYHLASVVDDHLMNISHIIRGEEWIPSTPKHILLYDYFGWTPPVFCHFPLLRNADKSKLSKRKNPTSVSFYRRLGILPEVLLNYLGLMGWAMPGGDEMFTLQEMMENFDINRMSLSGPIFDIDKLTWLNAKYIREKLTKEDILKHLKAWQFNDDYLLSVIDLLQGRLNLLSDFIPITSPMFSGMPEYDKKLLLQENLSEEDLKTILHTTLWAMEQLTHWNKDHLYKLFNQLADHHSMKLKIFSRIFYIVLTGKEISLPLFDSMEVLGSDMCRQRIIYGINQLGGPLGKKKLQKLESKLQSLKLF
ncbi:MAG: glutamate--tRNA ligase [Candidatus Magnetomorum sp.]|nr:glutamate--tRNA ligase [Candidatus Magnetomorum sp.]